MAEGHQDQSSLSHCLRDAAGVTPAWQLFLASLFFKLTRVSFGWTKSNSQHLEPMVEPLISWYFRGNHPEIPGFLGLRRPQRGGRNPPQGSELRNPRGSAETETETARLQ